jgi:hypothetical protein
MFDIVHLSSIPSSLRTFASLPHLTQISLSIASTRFMLRSLFRRASMRGLFFEASMCSLPHCRHDALYEEIICYRASESVCDSFDTHVVRNCFCFLSSELFESSFHFSFIAHKVSQVELHVQSLGSVLSLMSFSSRALSFTAPTPTPSLLSRRAICC